MCGSSGLLATFSGNYRVKVKASGPIGEIRTVLDLCGLESTVNCPTFYSINNKLLIMVFFMVSTLVTTGKPAPIVDCCGLFTIEWE